MRLSLLIAMVLMLTALYGTTSTAAPAPIVFLDIAGPEMAVQKAFYADLFGWTFSSSNETRIPVTGPLRGALRKDPVEKRVYIGVADVAGKLKEIAAHGGTIDAPRFEVPGVAILGLFRDPAGNPMGLVEMARGKAKIP